MVSYTHTTTTSTVYVVTIPVAALSTVLVSDPLLLDIKGVLAFHTYLFQSILFSFCSSSAMHLLSIVAYRMNYKSTTCTCIHVHMNW